MKRLSVALFLLILSASTVQSADTKPKPALAKPEPAKPVPAPEKKRRPRSLPTRHSRRRCGKT